MSKLETVGFITCFAVSADMTAVGGLAGFYLASLYLASLMIAVSWQGKAAECSGSICTSKWKPAKRPLSIVPRQGNAALQLQAHFRSHSKGTVYSPSRKRDNRGRFVKQSA